MPLLERSLLIKRSRLPNSGKGLFTKSFIPKGTKIVEYKGRISSWEDADHDDGENAYIYYVNRNRVIDAANYKKAFARYANDARGYKRIKGMLNNAVYIIEHKRVYIKAIKDIPAGSEIFVAYGKEYWDVIKKNAVL